MNAGLLDEMLVAVERNEIETVVSLLDNGVDINAVLKEVDPDFLDNGGDGFNRTCALVLAAGRNHADLVQVLLDRGAWINQRNDVEQTACHIAAERGHLAALNVLIARGANLALPDSEGAPPLYAAFSRDHADCCHALVVAGAPLDGEDDTVCGIGTD